MRPSATAKWIGLALLGLAISAAVAVAASNLVSQQIGIASESVSAGDALAPAVESAARRPNEGGSGQPQGSPSATTPAANGDNGVESDGGGTGEGGTGPIESTGEREDRLKDEEDAREDLEDQREDEAEDRLKAEEDALKDLEDDNSGKGSDD
jgi:hypothetical protein